MGTVGHRRLLTFTATVAYPYVHRDRAVATLSAALRHKVAAAGAGDPDWSTLDLQGLRELTGGHGRQWYEWQASVSARHPSERPVTASQAALRGRTT